MKPGPQISITCSPNSLPCESHHFPIRLSLPRVELFNFTNLHLNSENVHAELSDRSTQMRDGFQELLQFHHDDVQRTKPFICILMHLLQQDSRVEKGEHRSHRRSKKFLPDEPSPRFGCIHHRFHIANLLL